MAMNEKQKLRASVIGAGLSLLGLAMSIIQANENGLTTATLIGIIFTGIALIFTLIAIMRSRRKMSQERHE
jgi:hypothetical protein